MMFGAPDAPPPAPTPPQAPAPPPMFGEGKTATRKPRKPGQGMQPTFLGTPAANPTNTGMATLLGG